MQFVQKRPRCEAILLTGDNAAEVVTWCGGPAEAGATPDGSVMYKSGGLWQPPCAPGRYIARDVKTGLLNDHAAADFEREWTPAESE